MNKLTYHHKIRKMIKYLNNIDMMYSYVDCEYDEDGNSLYCRSPEMLFSAEFNEFVGDLPFDKDVKEMDVLQMLRMLNHCEEVIFYLERPCMGPYKEYVINQKTMK